MLYLSDYCDINLEIETGLTNQQNNLCAMNYESDCHKTFLNLVYKRPKKENC